MPLDYLTDDDIRAILTRTRRIALVGASANPARPSHGVLRFLLAQGYDVTPVNPGLTTLLGQPVAATLEAAGPLDMVDIFRESAAVGPIVADAIRLHARTIWLQLGVINEEAAALARAAGLTVVIDRCPAIEIPRLGL